MRPDLLEFVLEEFAEKAHRGRALGDTDANLAGQVRDTERSLGAEWLKAHGENWDDHGDKLFMASSEFAAWRSDYQKAPRHRAYIRSYRETRKTRGLCLDCPQKATVGRQHCDVCRAKRGQRTAAERRAA
jgi:hypothetical protein